MLEAATGERRPATWSAKEALSTVEPALGDQVTASARAVILYVMECIEALQGRGNLALH
jgi:hypothetical protein